MVSNERVLYIPGVGSEPVEQERLAELWSRFDVEVEIAPIDWSDTNYEERLWAIGNRIVDLSANERVSLVGASGGGKAVLSLLAKHPDNIHRVVTVSGKVGPYILGSGTKKAYPNLKISSDRLPLDIDELTECARNKILCVHPISDDDVKPKDTLLSGANELTINAHGHIVGIRQALTLYGYKLVEFIRSDDTSV
jgi:pimeloyl-ACP methyl ester carboxylesterase